MPDVTSHGVTTGTTRARDAGMSDSRTWAVEILRPDPEFLLDAIDTD